MGMPKCFKISFIPSHKSPSFIHNLDAVLFVQKIVYTVLPPKFTDLPIHGLIEIS